MKKRFEYSCDICDKRVIVLESQEDVSFAQICSHALNLGWQYAQTDESDILICPDCSEESTVLPISTGHKNQADSIKKVSSRMGLASAISLLFVISLSLIMLWVYDNSLGHKISMTKLTPVNNVKLEPNPEDIVKLAVSKSIKANEVFDEFYLEADETADVDPNIISKIEDDPEKYANKIEAVELSDTNDIYNDIDRKLTISKLKVDLQKALTGPLPSSVETSTIDISTLDKSTADTSPTDKDAKPKTRSKDGYTLVKKNIKGSLNTTALSAKLNSKQALALGKIFEDQINFKKDLTPKDTLSILFDDSVLKTDDKPIKLIQLTAKGKTYQAIQNEADKDSFKLLEEEKDFADLLDLIAQNKKLKATAKALSTDKTKPKGQEPKKKVTTKTEEKKTPEPAIHGKYAYYTNTINNTLGTAAEKIGLGFTHVKRLMHIFSYSVNSKRLAKGDQFSVIFDKNMLKQKGTKAKILAAEFITKGKRHQRVRYTDKNGKSAYYMLDSKGPTTTTYKTTTVGGSKSGFLRYPLRYKRISSGFNLRRRHPISRRIRPHKGTDFAAPRGTPVKATGNGVVSYSGWQRGYGRVVKIKHNNGKYETVYAHLSRINKRAKKGKTVRRGKVIGYVGSTGASTGNHLHYEFRVRNRAVNPLRIKLPKIGKVITTKVKNAKEYKRFKKQANLMKAELKYCRKKNQVLASARGK